METAPIQSGELIYFREDMKNMDIFLGFIAALGFNYPPRDWTQCAGQILAISDNTALYSLLSTYYGGDARVTYGIPELRGRAPIGYGTSPGQPTYPIGFKYGNTVNALTVEELPTHTHTAIVSGGGGTATGSLYASQESGDHQQPETGDFLATGKRARNDLVSNYVSPANKGTVVELDGLDVQGASTPPTVTNQLTGQGDQFSIMQPILAVNYSMVFQGLYPPRN